MQNSIDSFEMRTRGSLSGPCNVLDVLLSPRKAKDIDPRQYSFRMFCTVKAADKRYAELVNCGLWVASGVWKGDELIIEYVVLCIHLGVSRLANHSEPVLSVSRKSVIFSRLIPLILPHHYSGVFWKSLGHIQRCLLTNF